VNGRIVIPTSQELTRLGRFLLVGAAGTLLDFSLLMLLKGLGAPTLLANSVAFSAGLVNNYTLNRLWTFADRKQANWRKQLGQYLLVSLAGLALNNAIVLSLEGAFDALLEGAPLGYLLAKVLATGVVVFWNYIANRNWTFGREKQDIQSGEQAQASS